MSNVNLNINNRDYEVACADGEEEHLMRLSYELDRRVREMSLQVGTANQTTLLLMSGLQLLDELYEARNGSNKVTIQAEVETATASVLSQVAGKIENITEKLLKKAS